jgi:three-Cys-motif partner protein
MVKKFFDERSDQSEVKARIVQKYFFAWARVVMPTAAKMGDRIGYVDLYAGPGRYKDGSASTPLLILQHAVSDPKMQNMLVAYFNDADGNKTATLEAEISALTNINTLKHKPIVTCGEIDEEAAKFFGDMNLVPTFSFIDPFGYKGLSLNIIKNVIKDWGCDCVFFFNYNRINAGISNKAVAKHMAALFGDDKAAKLKSELPGLSPDLREAKILEELSSEIRNLGGQFVLPFTFRNSSGNRTSHKLIFVSKHFKGYEIMKDIMAKESSTTDEGVPSLIYSPADASMPLLFSLRQPLKNLKLSLLRDYAGRTESFDTIYQAHSVNTPYISSNYRAVLKELEEAGVISIVSSKPNRRKGTYAEHVKIRFP